MPLLCHAYYAAPPRHFEETYAMPRHYIVCSYYAIYVTYYGEHMPRTPLIITLFFASCSPFYYVFLAFCFDERAMQTPCFMPT